VARGENGVEGEGHTSPRVALMLLSHLPPLIGDVSPHSTPPVLPLPPHSATAAAAALPGGNTLSTGTIMPLASPRSSRRVSKSRSRTTIDANISIAHIFAR